MAVAVVAGKRGLVGSVISMGAVKMYRPGRMFWSCTIERDSGFEEKACEPRHLAIAYWHHGIACGKQLRLEDDKLALISTTSRNDGIDFPFDS